MAPEKSAPTSELNEKQEITRPETCGMPTSRANATMETLVAFWNAPSPKYTAHSATIPGPQIDCGRVTGFARPARLEPSAPVAASAPASSTPPTGATSRRSAQLWRVSCDCDGGSVVTSVSTMMAPMTAQTAPKRMASAAEMTASVDDSGFPMTHMHSSNAEHSDSDVEIFFSSTRSR